MTGAEDRDQARAAVDSSLPASLADAEQAVAEAERRAREARARAAELRAQAAGTTDADSTAEQDGVASTGRVGRIGGLRSRLHAPTRRSLEVTTAAILSVACLAASGYMVWQHMTLMHQRRQAAAYTAAARHGVELMMSIDPDHMRENVQTLIDNTTGTLQSQLRVTSRMLVEDGQKAKVSTKATVRDAAVQSMGKDTAVVLVVSESDTTNPDKSKRPAAFWRLSVTVDGDNGQYKMSNVEFVP